MICQFDGRASVRTLRVGGVPLPRSERVLGYHCGSLGYVPLIVFPVHFLSFFDVSIDGLDDSQPGWWPRG